MAKCPACQKRFWIFGRKETVCEECRKTYHLECTKEVLDYKSFINKKIKTVRLCERCAPETNQQFKEERYCAFCEIDIPNNPTTLANCYKCGEIYHQPCALTVLDYESFTKGEIKTNRICKKCAIDNNDKFMEERYCVNCKIDIPNNATKVANCSYCSKIFHQPCGINGLDYDGYKNGQIKKNLYCPQCKSVADENLSKFGSDRYCSQCQEDITRDCDLDRCEICNGIKCKSCLILNGRSIFKNIRASYREYLKIHNKVCDKCSINVRREVEQITQRLDFAFTRAIIIKSSSIKKYRIRKSFDFISIKTGADELFDEEKCQLKLLKKAVGLGGNAIYEYNLQKVKKQVIKGYSSNNNPYYGTAVSFILSGKAVLIEEEKAVDYSHHLVLLDSNIWEEYGPEIGEHLTKPLKTLIPQPVIDRVDRLKAGKDIKKQEMARKLSGRWEGMKRSEKYDVEIPVNKRPAMILDGYKNASLKTDIEILSYANWYSSMNLPIFLVSNDNDLLLICRELKSQENRPTLDCGRLEDFIQYLERIYSNEMKSAIEGLKGILRRAKELREIQRNLESQNQMNGLNGFPIMISLESSGAGNSSSRVENT